MRTEVWKSTLKLEPVFAICTNTCYTIFIETGRSAANDCEISEEVNTFEEDLKKAGRHPVIH